MRTAPLWRPWWVVLRREAIGVHGRCQRGSSSGSCQGWLLGTSRAGQSASCRITSRKTDLARPQGLLPPHIAFTTKVHSALSSGLEVPVLGASCDLLLEMRIASTHSRSCEAHAKKLTATSGAQTRRRELNLFTTISALDGISAPYCWLGSVIGLAYIIIE
jgi:hypothetical protein